MMRIGGLAAVLLMASVAAGCSTASGGGGSSLSAFTAADSGDAAAGAIAINLDGFAARAAREAEQKALEFGRAGTPVGWKAGRVYGDVVPGTVYQVNDSTCRDYMHTVYIGGSPQKVRGTACRQANGAWQPVT